MRQCYGMGGEGGGAREMEQVVLVLDRRAKLVTSHPQSYGGVVLSTGRN